MSGSKRFFVYRENLGRFKGRFRAKSWATWYIPAAEILAEAETYKEALQMAREMNSNSVKQSEQKVLPL